MSTGRLAERRCCRQRVASREQPSRDRGRGQIVACLVGYGAGFPLWPWAVERRVVVGKVVAKVALPWSARGGRQAEGLAGLAWASRPWASFKAALALLADVRLSPLAALGLSDTECPALACSFPKAQRVGKGAVSPLVRCKMVVMFAYLGAGGGKAPRCVGQPASVCLFRRWAAPNRACSGHGFAVGSPWWLVGRSSVACCGGWTATPCR